MGTVCGLLRLTKTSISSELVHLSVVLFFELWVTSVNFSCRLMTQWRMTRGTEEQTRAFLDGFNEVVPLEWLKYFDERELELLLCGMQEIDVEDWMKNTIYR